MFSSLVTALRFHVVVQNIGGWCCSCVKKELWWWGGGKGGLLKAPLLVMANPIPLNRDPLKPCNYTTTSHRTWFHGRGTL